MKPLADTRILDLTRLLPGAEVIKVDNPRQVSQAQDGAVTGA